jgi:predicted RNase H-like HicB family nuclease
MKRSVKKRIDVNRPFDPGILREAKRIAARYRLIVEPDPEAGFLGRVAELPGVFADGKTQADCVRMLVFAAETTVATYLEEKKSAPSPISDVQRREQVNIRLTPEEKAMLSAASERKGFKGISDFVRSAALRECITKAG